MGEDAWLTGEVIAAVANHMNTDHADDNVVICRGLGGCESARAARFVDMDLESGTFIAETDEGEIEVRVPFENPVTERAEIRAEVAALYHRSAERLGLPPRT